MGAQITGWSHLPFGKRDEPDVESLMRAVTSDALRHAGVEGRDVDRIFVGVMNNGFSRQGFEASLVGVGEPELSQVPAMRAENACATGSAALYAALDYIEAGRGRIALVVGAEKMTAMPTGDVGDVLLCASYHREESRYDGFAGIFAEITRRYFARYGDKSREMAMIAAKNHRNGVGNPFAHIRKDLGFDFCNSVSEKNPYVAEPLRRTDCSPISDGAAALVLADERTARSLPRRIGFRARSQANDILPISRRDPLEFAGARRAWAQSLGAAGLSLEDLDLVEVHDCFTIAELIEYEAMGWVPRGEGARVVCEGWAEKGGRLPVNPSGGLKAKGHPIGATGVSMHIVAAMQLLGEAGDLQVPDARLAGVFNMGGVSVANYVSILERVE
ncbi:MAG: thiolase domain-containing protein [Planctomycetes bacterium]|nr:thiolase domain-containing protein [Planctomycetota bacterium]